MNQPASNKAQFFSYYVWDRSVRLFHWINLICVLGLISVGLVILYDKSLGVSDEGKIILKTVHAYFGYVFVLNLAWRVVWGFVGNSYSRWKSLLPFGKGYKDALGAYLSGIKGSHPPSYAGHNPLARLMVAFLFLLLISQAVTGLVLAGTDLYLPPFGHEIAEWVTGSGEQHSKLAGLKPGAKEGLDQAAYKEMRAFRKPFITTHKYGFYTLVIAILLHIAAVVVTELREKSALVSAMITGNKLFTERPLDAIENEEK